MPEIMKGMTWLLLYKTNEDGRSMIVLDEDDLGELLEDGRDFGVKQFHDKAWWRANRDQEYGWKEGDAVLLEVKVLVPKVVTKAWELED